MEAGPNGEMLVDVRLFAERLPPNYGKLVKAARQWSDGHSCASDLDLARLSVDDALSLKGRQDPLLDHAVMALVHSAIIGYGRVFDDSAKLRGNLPIVGTLDREGLEFHRKIMNLRHRAVAHFAGEGTHKPWAQDQPVIILGPNTYQTFASANRSMFDRDFTRALLAHLSGVCQTAARLANERRLQFESKLLAAWTGNAEIDGLLRSSLLDPADLLGWGGPILGGDRCGRTITIAAHPPIA